MAANCWVCTYTESSQNCEDCPFVRLFPNYNGKLMTCLRFLDPHSGNLRHHLANLTELEAKELVDDIVSAAVSAAEKAMKHRPHFAWRMLSGVSAVFRFLVGRFAAVGAGPAAVDVVAVGPIAVAIESAASGGRTDISDSN